MLRNAFRYVRLGVLTAVNIKIMVFWAVKQCNLVDRYDVSKEPTATILKL
jgi:hypothetical protein